MRYNAYITRGRYTEYLRYLYQVFPDEQIYLVLFENLKKFPKQTCDQLFGFFELNRYDADVSNVYNEGGDARLPLLARLLSSRSPHKMLLHKVIPASLKSSVRQKLRSLNKKKYRTERPPIKKETEAMLKGYYKEFNHELERDYNLDITSWI